MPSALQAQTLAFSVPASVEQFLSSSRAVLLSSLPALAMGHLREVT